MERLLTPGRGSNLKRWVEDRVFAPVVQGAAGVIEALDQRPEGLPEGAPYTTPLRMVSAAGAALPAGVGVLSDVLRGVPTPTGAGVMDPLRAPEDQATFQGEVAKRGGGGLAQTMGTLADLFVGPEHGAQVLGAVVPVVAGAARAAKAAKAAGARAVKQIAGGGFEAFKETGRRGFQFLPLDAAARARMQSFNPSAGPVAVRSLPASARPTAVYQGIIAPGSTGYSVHPATGQQIVPGQPGPRMVGVFPNSSNRTAIIPLAQFTPKDVDAFFQKNRDQFAKHPEYFMGGWVSKIDGVPHVFLDVSQASDTSRAATKIGELQNPGGAIRAGKINPKATTKITRNPDGTWPKAQEAIFEPERFDAAAGVYGEAPVGNSAEFIGSPAFQRRIDEMAGVGRTLMQDGNWWDIRGGPMERVYGKDMLEPVAGYFASTSPQNPPRPNARMASELIRRHIKNEPVVQPEWRAPADAIGEGFSPSPGAAMPAPNTWANNATKVREGRPDTMFDDKVNDMFHAMIGKLVGVYDRHWAKLAEDPARGIYTDTMPNKISGSMKSGVLEAYPLIDNAVRTAAKRAGVDVARYSAWAWEGIRDTIRQTGELYGQKHKASAIPSGNEGFNEIFEALILEKAAHLRITVGELEQRLRSGDASLLTALLATPVGAAAYARWRATHESEQATPGGGGA
jgi:hypothetical protein